AWGSQTFILNVAANPFPWQNPASPLDTSNDPAHAVVALDALIVFNLLNNPGTFLDSTGRLPRARPAGSAEPYYDTNGDGFVTSLDALLIINDLNIRASGEGELRPSAMSTSDATASNDSASANGASDLQLALEGTLSIIAEDVW